MDINIAITRAGIFAVVYTIVLGIPFWFGIKTSLWQYSTIIMAFLATTGPFIYLYIQKRAENRLLREQRQYQETLRQASSGMTRVHDLKKLFRLILYTVTQALKLNYAYVYLFNPKNNSYSLQEAMNENINSLDEENPLIKYLKDYRQPVVYEELKRQSEEGAKTFYSLVESEMKKIKASVIIPNFVEDKLLGFIVLGDKISGQIFSEDDLVSLQFLGNQAALAIENAIAYEELKTTKGKLLVAEKLASIGRLAAGIAHEIKNPLTSIKTFTEYLNEKFNESEFRNKFSRIVGGEVDRINHIVEGLLDFAQPKTPKTKLTDIQQIIEDVLILLENDIAKNKIEVKKDFISGLSPVLVDPEQIKQVFINLIINSLQAMENSLAKKLTIATSKLDDYISIKISDTGCGLSQEQINSIFEPFYSTKEKGVGLGLSIVHSIIQAHSGRIEVSSEVNKGTSFTVIFPIAHKT
jgi:signal transduction histidine kinase